MTDVFQNFRKMCLEICQLDTEKFILVPGLAWPATLKKKTDAELELLTDIDMLLMVEKRIVGGMHHSINKYAKANNKYIKNKNKESSYLKYWDANNLNG